jgi:hypothetical protein
MKPRKSPARFFVLELEGTEAGEINTSPQKCN